MIKELKNSVDYIKTKAGNKTGFTTPVNYFDSFEDTIAIKIAEEKFTKETAFKVPDAYFSGLEDSVLSKVLSTEKETKIRPFKERIIKMIPLAAAASVILFIGLNSFNFNKPKDITFEKLADSEVENWVSNNIDVFNHTDFVLTDDDIDFEESDAIINLINNDDLENYLSNQLDISLILEND